MITIDRPDHFAIRFGRLLPPVAADRGRGIGSDALPADPAPILFFGSPPCAVFARREVSPDRGPGRALP